jgi:lipopolysaccharide export system protein LptC
VIRRFAAWFPLAVLAGVAALTWWIDQKVSSEPADREVVRRHDPDVIADRIEALKLGPEGAPAYRLTAENIVHFADDGTSILTAPLLVQYGKQAPLSARAKSAASDDRGSDVYLYEDVVLTRAAYGKQSELTVKTSWLHAQPDLGLVQTDRPVTIRDANTVLTSIGLEFDNRTRTLKLLSDVRGLYDKKGLPANARP